MTSTALQARRPGPARAGGGASLGDSEDSWVVTLPARGRPGQPECARVIRHVTVRESRVIRAAAGLSGRST